MKIWAFSVCAGEYLNPYKKQYTFEAALIHFSKMRYLNPAAPKVLTNEKEQQISKSTLAFPYISTFK